MAFAPIAFTLPQYEDFSNYWVKAFEQGTTTPKVMAIDPSGSPTVAKLELDAQGFPRTVGNALVIPYIDGAYDLWMFPTEAEADANDTSNAVQLADNMTPGLGSQISVIVKGSSSLDVEAYLNNTKAADYAALRVLDSSLTGDGDAYDVTNDGVGGEYIVKTGTVTDNGAIFVVFADNPNRYLERLDQRRITVDMFEAVGDAKTTQTDNATTLQNAFDWSEANRKPIFLRDGKDNVYYTSTTLDAGDAIIRSIGGVPGLASPASLSGVGSAYYYHTTQAGIDTTWSTFISDANTIGPAIVSDVDAAILNCSDGFQHDIDGIAVIGDHRKTSQDGIATDAPTTYEGNIQDINHTNVFGCGRHGINLQRGFEVSTMTKVRCVLNNGHGLRAAREVGVNSPVEFLEFKDCDFTTNRLDGVRLEHAKKHIMFKDGINNISGNGQYDGATGVDPLLGYDRTIPATNILMSAGIRIEDVDLDGTQSLFGLNFTGCFGEQIAKAFHIRGKTGSGIVRDVVTGSNTFLRAASSFSGDAGVMLFVDVDFMANWVLGPSERQALSGYQFVNETPGGDSTNGVLFLDDGAPVGTSDLRELIKLKYPAPISSPYYMRATGRVYADASVLVRDRNDGTTHTFPEVATDFTLNSGSNLSNVVAIYSLTAHFQSAGSDSYGGYMLWITKFPSGNYNMVTFAGTPTSGFSSVPTISTGGTVTAVTSDSSRRLTLQRIDNVLSNATP